MTPPPAEPPKKRKKRKSWRHKKSRESVREGDKVWVWWDGEEVLTKVVHVDPSRRLFVHKEGERYPVRVGRENIRPHQPRPPRGEVVTKTPLEMYFAALDERTRVMVSDKSWASKPSVREVLRRIATGGLTVRKGLS